MNKPNFIGTRSLKPGEVFDPTTMKLFDIDEAYEAEYDAMFDRAFGDTGIYHPVHRQTPEENMQEFEEWARSQEQPARKAIAQAAPITNRLMQSKSDMEAFAALSPEQKQAIIQFAKQNGIAKYVGSDNISMIRQAWRNRGR